MKNTHLTEEEVQQYTLDVSHCSRELIEHIAQCKHCQQQVLHYELLFEGIKTQRKEGFDFDLSALVMQQLPQARPGYDSFFPYSLAIIIVMMAGMVGYVFGNSLVSLFALVQPILIGLVIITALGLMVFLSLDMYQKYKAQMRRLSVY